MLPRPRSGLVVYCVRLFAVGWSLRPALGCTLFIGLSLSACSDKAAETQQGPATTVPHGLLDLAANTSKTMPRKSAVAALAELTQRRGLEYHSLQHDGADAVALIEIDLARFAPEVMAESRGLSPATAISKPNLNVIVGSSFVSQVRRMQPIGVLQIDGRLLQDVEPHGYTRILGIRELNPKSSLEKGGQASNSPNATARRFEVAHRSQWPLEGLHSALQAGPGIIEKGLLDISERDLTRQKYFRSFVAECGERAVVGATLVPMHLYTLGGQLLKFFAANQLSCPEVVNLAGDREAVLVVRHGQEAAYLGDPQSPKVGLIGFTEL